MGLICGRAAQVVTTSASRRASFRAWASVSPLCCLLGRFKSLLLDLRCMMLPPSVVSLIRIHARAGKYSHADEELLSVQIDAAINSGKL